MGSKVSISVLLLALCLPTAVIAEDQDTTIQSQPNSDTQEAITKPAVPVTEQATTDKNSNSGVPKVSKDGDYYIQIGVFPDLEKANQIINIANPTGIPCFSEIKDTVTGTKYNVRCGWFVEKDDAIKAFGELKNVGLVGMVAKKQVTVTSPVTQTNESPKPITEIATDQPRSDSPTLKDSIKTILGFIIFIAGGIAGWILSPQFISRSDLFHGSTFEILKTRLKYSGLGLVAGFVIASVIGNWLGR